MRETTCDIVRLPGGTLLVWLLRHAAEQGLSKDELAGSLGVSYGYIQQLRTGARAVPQVSDEFAGRCALLLGLPKLLVLYAAGKLSAADSYSPEDLTASSINRAIDIILHDPKYGPLVRPELLEAPQCLKFSFIWLYEAASGKAILGTSFAFEDLKLQMARVSAGGMRQETPLKAVAPAVAHS